LAGQPDINHHRAAWRRRHAIFPSGMRENARDNAPPHDQPNSFELFAEKRDTYVLSSEFSILRTGCTWVCIYQICYNRCAGESRDLNTLALAATQSEHCLIALSINLKHESCSKSTYVNTWNVFRWEFRTAHVYTGSLTPWPQLSPC